MRPSVIFRAFQQDDRPTSYLQGHDGRTIGMYLDDREVVGVVKVRYVRVRAIVQLRKRVCA